MKYRLPPWLIKRTPKQRHIRAIRSLLGDDALHTVCESAKCPNIGECYAHKTLTFMILGNTCTRRCHFCSIDVGRGEQVDATEPIRVAEAAKKLGLKHVVVTSVTRDDLPDGGAPHFAQTIDALREAIPEVTVEVLIPDFKGDLTPLKIVVDAAPEIVNHNIETVPRLSPQMRPQAKYPRSLELLARVKEMAPHLTTKSGIMVGLGETEAEVYEVLADLARVQCDVVTIGQYLQSDQENLPVKEYVRPEVFRRYQEEGEKMGIAQVVSGPFIRSSYQFHEGEAIPAERDVQKIRGHRPMAASHGSARTVDRTVVPLPIVTSTAVLTEVA